MSTKVLLEVDARHESILRRALAMVEEMEQLALTAPDGTVFGACEEAVIHKGRDLQRQMLADAAALRIGSGGGWRRIGCWATSASTRAG